MLGRTFDVSKIAKTPFHTLNIDRITKPQKFNLKNISIQHMKQKKLKYCVTMAYLSLKYCGKIINIHMLSMVLFWGGLWRYCQIWEFFPTIKTIIFCWVKGLRINQVQKELGGKI